MKTPLIALIAATTAACSDPKGTTPDASVGLVDALDGVPDAMADAMADAMEDAAPSMCPAGMLCMQLTPTDGVTNLPAGRLAIAWLVDGANETPSFEVAYDQPWTVAPVTMVELSQIALPSVTAQQPFRPCGNAPLAAALAVLSTDPDASGSITSEEILAGISNHTVYGIHQEIVAWMEAACPPMPPTFPAGFLAGVHVYTQATPVQLLDGTITELQTCQPGTTGCADLEGPL